MESATVVLLLSVAILSGGCKGRAGESDKPPTAARQSAAAQPSHESDEVATTLTAEDEPAAAPEAEVNPPAPRAAEPPTAAETPAPAVVAATPADGKTLYARHCAACHGEQGDGQGVAAAWLFPKPRDFRSGKFRLVSTTNSAPTRDDLHAVLLRGMPGSSMPPWEHLTLAERDLLVDEVLRLYREGARHLYLALLKEQEGLEDDELEDPEIQEEADAFVTRRTAPGEAATVPEMAPADEAAVARGKALYASQGCAACHGDTGKGDGQQQMVDDEKLPTRPRDLTQGIFKGGHDPASVYRRIAYGMPGTPMPSSSKMTPEQMVDVVHFILSLSDEPTRQAAILNREKVVAASVKKAPDALDDPTWSQAAAVSLRMAPLWWRDNADPDLQVQALHDGEMLALRISWRDPVLDQHESTTQSFEDGVAVELTAGGPEPFLGMGGAKEPVEVWLWSAGRETAKIAVDDVYPRTVVDVYPFHESAVATPEFGRDGARDESQPAISLPARAVGNPLAEIGSQTAATSHAGSGPSTLTFRPPANQRVTAHGQWSEGRWSVVMRRPLAAPTPADGASLAPGGKASIAFAVWDGNQRDRDGKKLVTIWQDLELAK